MHDEHSSSTYIFYRVYHKNVNVQISFYRLNIFLVSKFSIWLQNRLYSQWWYIKYPIAMYFTKSVKLFHFIRFKIKFILVKHPLSAISFHSQHVFHKTCSFARTIYVWQRVLAITYLPSSIFYTIIVARPIFYKNIIQYLSLVQRRVSNLY